MAITKATASAVAPAAKGDLVVGSATNDAAVLGVGTDGQYLTAASTTTTGLQWTTLSAGGMTSLASGSIASAATGVDISSISSSYQNLVLQLRNYSTNAAGEYGLIYVRFNNDSTSGNYKTLYGGGSATWTFLETSQTAGIANNLGIAAADTGLGFTLEIPNYADSTTYKYFTSVGQNRPNYPSTSLGSWNSKNAITRVTIVIQTGAFDSGTYELFGVK